MSSIDTLPVPKEHDGVTLAAFVRLHRPGHSWSQVRRIVATRRVRIGGEVCLDPARRLHAGETVELSERPAAKPAPPRPEIIRHLDQHVVVVEKPTGINSVRHPLELGWKQRRRQLSPTMEDILPPLIAQREGRTYKGLYPRLRIVHRLDKATSGVMVFARTQLAETELGQQFRKHTTVRRYLAIVPGQVEAQRIASKLIRDRGDGRRGSGTLPGMGRRAVTHIAVEETLPGYTLLSCRLETGRTHQIRIHLAELGHPVCGEKVYILQRDGKILADNSGAPRLALHATELGFVHPLTKASMHWDAPLPEDLRLFLDNLRGAGEPS
jgi:23S rRNA pseudouridine1911/1915/1917 synthase